MTQTYHTDKRLQLLANGYAIIPNRGKVPAMVGWNEPDYVTKQLTDNAKGTAAERVARWEARFAKAVSTGVRIENGLGVVDSDTDNERMTIGLWGALQDIAPEVHSRAPLRFGGGEHKAALFVRIEGERWVRIASRRYPQGCLEIFGGAPLRSGRCSRQFGILGPHSFNDDGSVAREYVWADEDSVALCKVPAGDLPTLSKAQAYALVAAFERLAEEFGWVSEATPVTDSAGAVYDIDENTRFDTDLGHTQIDYADLADLQEMHTDLRCASNFMAGRDGVDRSRCWVFHSARHDCTAVYVYGDEQTHYPASRKPISPEELNKLLQDLPDPTPAGDRPSPPDDKASLFDKAKWLLETHAYCALEDRVVELYTPDDACQMKFIGFQRLFQAWHEEEIGPRDGVTRNYATSIWCLHRTRINVRGVRMRPDRPFPAYAEAGETYKNTYLAPRHDTTGGDVSLFVAFMEHLLPDLIEREWFCNWIAHKHRFPGVPGVAVVMVAVDERGPVYGAGRGMLRDILARLLGPRYVKPLDFDVFTGRSAQGAYTDWGAYSVLITVNEAKDTPGSGQWAERRAVYERLKELVDPRAIERTFQRKGLPAFSAHAFASYLVFSNNRDALQIPEDDRRVAALANGVRLPPEQAAALQQWMDDPANITALARWLEARDLADFDVYTPLHTQTKATMQDLARSEIDEALDAVRRVIGPHGLFTGEQLRAALIDELSDSSEPTLRNVKRIIRGVACRLANEARMPPAAGRFWIMAWRGHDTGYITDIEAARTGVEHTGRRLAEARGEKSWAGR